MLDRAVLNRREHLTHKGNQRSTRYGWLRLTPAYSVHLVAELLDSTATPEAMVLDPFCGTGTTALVCAERGIACDTTDINPFLLWLTRAKTHAYTDDERHAFQAAIPQIAAALREAGRPPIWLPSLHQIEKWWDSATLAALGRAIHAIGSLASELPEASVDLLRIAFCRLMIDRAHVSFGHQSMSFKPQAELPLLALIHTVEEHLAVEWERLTVETMRATHSPILSQPRALLGDARSLTAVLATGRYTHVVTSPPYPNRMSYIRELRPYMYWLGYLTDARAAGELDWQAIGGTWGCATSNLVRWRPEREVMIPYPGFSEIISAIGQHSPVLSSYVHKYFHDMVEHVTELGRVLHPGGTVAYIVGNSKFYDVLLPVEEIFAALFRFVGFEDITIRPIRKRTSKKELYEYVVSARR